MERVLVVLSLFLALVSACSYRGRTEVKPKNSVPYEEKAYFSDSIVYGRVVQKVSDSKYGAEFDTTYGINVEVACTYKGPALYDAIKIIGAGTLPGCPDMEVNENEFYVFYLKNYTSDEFEMEFTPTIDALLDEMTIVCNLSRKFPIGMPVEVQSDVCSPVETENCIEYTTTQPPPTYKVVTEPQTTKATTDIPKPGPGEGDNGKPGASKTDVDNPTGGAAKSVAAMTLLLVSIMSSVWLL